MTPVEIIALIAVIAVAIKLVVILIQPKVWYSKVVKPVYSKPALTMIVSLILAGIVLYYLLQSLTIVQIFAAWLFLALLSAITITTYSKELLSMAEKMLKNKSMLNKAWLSILIWIILVVWALYVLLF